MKIFHKALGMQGGALVLLMTLTLACQSQQPVQQPLDAEDTTGGTETGTSGSGSGETTGTSSGGTDGPPPDLDYNLCDVVKGTDLDRGFNDVVDRLCNDYIDRLTAASNLWDANDFNRNSESGDYDKILVEDQDGDLPNDELEYYILNANLLPATPSDYNDLNTLRLKKPDVYKDEGFKVNPDTKICDVVARSVSVTQETINDSDNDRIHYRSRTNFFNPERDVYVSSTLLTDNMQETLRDLRSITVIMPYPESNSESLVYTISYQKVFKSGQEDSVLITKARRNFRGEMRRNIQNAERADEAKDLEDRDSNVPRNCDNL